MMKNEKSNLRVAALVYHPEENSYEKQLLSSKFSGTKEEKAVQLAQLTAGIALIEMVDPEGKMPVGYIWSAEEILQFAINWKINQLKTKRS